MENNVLILVFQFLWFIFIIAIVILFIVAIFFYFFKDALKEIEITEDKIDHHYVKKDGKMYVQCPKCKCEMLEYHYTDSMHKDWYECYNCGEFFKTE